MSNEYQELPKWKSGAGGAGSGELGLEYGSHGRDLDRDDSGLLRAEYRHYLYTADRLRRCHTGFDNGNGGLNLTGGLPTAGGAIVTGGSTVANFAKWYVDSTGFNLSTPTSLSLSEGPAGTFSYSSSAFFPIDGLLYGNQGNPHNYHFTMHLEGLLSFSDPTLGADKIFTFTGDDDLWIFVDGKLVMDLGGVHGAVSGSFTEEDLKLLGLTAATSYDLDIFFAERHTSESNFAITTTLEIAPPVDVPEPGTLLLAGSALLALLSGRRRRA